MKFREDSDKVLFLLEAVDNLQDLDFNQIDEDLIAEFLKKRKREKTFEIKDFRKAQLQKHNWRAKKLKYMRGIRKFHRSIAGKKFHRSISRFLLTRESFDRVELLKAVSSLRTHLFIDLDYYRQLDEAVDFEIFVEDLSDTIGYLESELIKGREVDPKDFVVLLEALNYSDIVRAMTGADATDEPDYANYVEMLEERFPFHISNQQSL